MARAGDGNNLLDRETEAIFMGGFTFRDMIVNGWPVLSFLTGFSIVSATIICDRFVAFKLAAMNARLFVANVIKILEEQGDSRALAYCDRFRKPIAAVVAEILLQPGGREDRERALRHALQVQIHDLERWIPVLGTIAGTAPFVGLLGTVVGIIKAFHDISVNVGGGPEVVSAGIAEALITTAFGLVVAIPAVMFFNYFIHKVQKMADEIDIAAYELIEKLSGAENSSR
jgi:biopolymer transport protein ExbB/biopolymer transport protein TolQ